MTTLIDVDVFYQTLLDGLNVTGLTVAADLDPNSSDTVPLLTHSATLGRSGNGPNLWHSVLSLNLFIEASTDTFSTIQDLYNGIVAWGETPRGGVVPGMAGVEELGDIEAFSRLGQSVLMDNKYVTQYVGSFELSLRNI